MSSSKHIVEFPDVEAKLQVPSKKSAFERQKAEAEAKRQREAAETAAVYKDFVKSFDNDNDGPAPPRDARPGHGRFDRPGRGGHPPIGGTMGKRHFGTTSGPSSMKSGPGSLGPAPMSFGKKRSFEGFSERKGRDEGRGRLNFDEGDSTSISKAFDASDDEEDNITSNRAEEKAIARPTLRLANLPPATSPAVIKSLIPTNLAVENVKILPPVGVSNTDRKSSAAIVTLSADTAASEIDTAVSALQNRYLGFGHYLSLHRHLSSAAMSANLTSLTSSANGSQPFGAKPVPQSLDTAPAHLRRGRGFAPPSSFAPPSGPGQRAGILHIPIQAPRDIKQLRMIHKVIEGILEHGPEFEALIMSRPDVQREEKWAWIWDARSQGGVWYRYRLWEIISGLKFVKGQGRYMPLFEGGSAWKVPDEMLAYEYSTAVDEFVSDSDYNSSDDDDYDDEPTKSGDPSGKDPEETFLNPFEKSKLTHMLARLPTSLSKLRKGDVARVTAFAITHASRGSDEIVDLIVSNVEQPLSSTQANPDHKGKVGESHIHERHTEGSPVPDDKGGGESQDTSAAKLIALYVVSDILSSSSTSGVRHAWRYRQLFENALQKRKTFEGLGLMADKHQWGRLRAEKWKRSIGLVLNHWEGWCVFSNEAQTDFVHSFENPPRLKKEEKAEEDSSKKGRWKTMEKSVQNTEDAGSRPFPAGDSSNMKNEAETNQEGAETGVDSESSYDEYTDDEDLDAECLEDEDIDGQPILENGMEGLKMDDDTPMDET